ncbi:thiamine phosphate synthase [uncultured Sphingomonas sp.]|uniref:thiamine phosphate synthase n=1 Tax=uncultured Sphingomonas sp. TaxID=158754 RepID=UPI002595EFF4|nr:thiamine phosphate synthase [uncultured Sphingomonas sp.]
MRDLNRNLNPMRAAWLMTDPRMPDDPVAALRALPPGAGVVFRHRDLPRADRHALFLRVRRIAAARRLRISAAGDLQGAPGHGGRRPLTHAAHDRRQAVAGARAGARYLFVSPVYPTRSHPGARPLGSRRAAAIARGLPVATIALGGMTPRRFLRLRHVGFDGWAAIDALSGATSRATSRATIA